MLVEVETPQEKEEVVIENGKLKRITVGYAFSITISIMVGTGIFMVINKTFIVFGSDSIGFVIVFWLIAGGIAILGGLSYAELSSRVPECGAERAYFKIALNQKFSFTFVIMSFIVRSMSIAALAITAAEYFLIIFNIEKVALLKLVAFTIILICFVSNCISKALVNKTGVVFTVLKFMALSIIIGSGIYSLATDPAPEWKEAFKTDKFNFKHLGECFVALFWAFDGFTSAGYVAGEMKNPQKDLPIAIISAVSLVVVLYTLCVVSYSAILGFDKVRESKTIGQDVANKMLKKAAPILSILISCSAIGAANAEMYIVPSLLVSSSVDDEILKIFSLVHKKSRVPIVSLILTFLFSVLFLTFDFETLTYYFANITWTFYFLAFTSLIILKIKQKNIDKSKIVQIPIPCIIILQLVSFFMVVMSFVAEYIGCIVISVVTIIVYCSQYIPKKFYTSPTLTQVNNTIIQKSYEWFNLVPATRNDIS